MATHRRIDWERHARALANLMAYQADACEHRGSGGEACCQDYNAYQAFVDDAGIDYRANMAGPTVNVIEAFGPDREFMPHS